jgi:hypothetical protein
VRLVALELCDLELNRDQARRIVRETEGNLRKTVVLLHHLETRRRAHPEAEVGEMVEQAARRAG